MTTCLALLATSPPERFSYHWEVGSAGPPVTLTSSAPRASFVVTVRANALGPEGLETTRNASSFVQGSVSTEGATGRFVAVSVVDGALPGAEADLEVATAFSVPRSLTFNGNCADPTQGDPCEATLRVDFERTDGGEGGGTVNIEWSLELDAQAEKSDSPNVGPLEAPWSVEIAPQ